MGLNLDNFAGGFAKGFSSTWNPELVEKIKDRKERRKLQEESIIEQRKRNQEIIDIRKQHLNNQEAYQKSIIIGKIADLDAKRASASNSKQYNALTRGINSLRGDNAEESIVDVKIKDKNGISHNVGMTKSSSVEYLKNMDRYIYGDNGSILSKQVDETGDVTYQDTGIGTIKFTTADTLDTKFKLDKAQYIQDVKSGAFKGSFSKWQSKQTSETTSDSYDKFFNPNENKWVSIKKGEDIPSGYITESQLKDFTKPKKEGVFTKALDKVLADKTAEFVGMQVKDEVVEEITSNAASEDNIVFNTQLNDKQKDVFVTGVKKYVHNKDLTPEDLKVFYDMSDAQKVDFILRNEGYELEEESLLYQMLPNIFGISDVKLRKKTTK